MKILFAADLITDYFEEYIGDEAVNALIEDVKPAFEKADFRMINLECVYDNGFTPIIKSGPPKGTQTEFVSILTGLGIDVCGLANNHAGDYKDEGLFYTMDVLKKKGISYVGAGKNIDEAYKAHVFEKDGEKVSVIAVCENEFGTAKRDAAGSAGYRLGLTAQKIWEEKEKGNKVTVYFHGGNEHNPFPSPIKQELYRHFIDLGADAVVAMHTHCPQGYEIYKEKPIIYSMGNFFFPYEPEGEYSDPNHTFYYGYLTELSFEGEKVGVNLIPYHYTNEKIELLKDEKLDIFNDYMKKMCEPLFDEESLERHFEGWCLIGGLVYAEHAKYDKSMMHDQIKIKNIKNAFCCEAHADLLNRFLTLCYELRSEEAIPYRDKILDMQRICAY